MRLLGLSLLCLLVTGKKGRPESPKREGPETVSPDEGSTRPQEEDGNEKDQTDEAGHSGQFCLSIFTFFFHLHEGLVNH